MRASIRSIVPTCGRRGHLRPGGSGPDGPSCTPCPSRRTGRRRRSSDGTSPKSASRSRSRSSPSKCCSRSCRRRASRSTSAASAGAGCSTQGSSTDLFNGRYIGQPGSSNWSYFNSAKYNRLLDRALSLPVGPRALRCLRRARRADLSGRRARHRVRSAQPAHARLPEDGVRGCQPGPRPDGGVPQVTATILERRRWSAEDRQRAPLTSSVERSLEGHPDSICSDSDPARPVAHDQDVGDAVRARVDT